MARLTNEEIGKIISLYIKDKSIEDISKQLDIGSVRVKNLIHRLLEMCQPLSSPEPDTIDYSSHVLNLIEQGLSEQESYYLVFSTKLEEDYADEDEFLIKLQQRNRHNQPDVHNQRAVAMTHNASNADTATGKQTKQPRPDYIFSADGK